MSEKAKPTVVLAIKVRKKDARYDLLDVAVNGALIVNPSPRSGDLLVPVPPELVSRDMDVHVRLKSAKGSIQAATLLWSSYFQDDPTTADDERWVRVGNPQAGDGVLLFEKTIDPYGQKDGGT
ncbi:hypothetical protein NR798_27325 [Archangium gephyra]|uniref:hypothetical protein n=1 Tax=Archangium gephyra TaxID=48 RepID=UPI0035D4A14D